MVLPAGKGDVSESQTEARRGFVDGYGCRVNELFRDVAGDADVAEAEDAGNEQQASDRPASAPQSARHRAFSWEHHCMVNARTPRKVTGRTGASSDRTP